MNISRNSKGFLKINTSYEKNNASLKIIPQLIKSYKSHVHKLEEKGLSPLFSGFFKLFNAIENYEREYPELFHTCIKKAEKSLKYLMIRKIKS